ncbi:DUF2897 family protein [Corallincola platygyrae]|uniref:DUF2897 family protein n=1 Tax=Corallincola platygyrae TaxID=1193278 RepID=A0ABW4XUP2_9GAMM
MTGWQLALLIACVLGVVVGNIMLLKHTANVKLDKRLDELKHGRQIKPSAQDGHKKSPSQTETEQRPSRRL